MAQAKKKTATRTAKKTTRQGQARKKTCTRTSKKQQAIDNRERMHVYIVTAMGMITALLLCANAVMLTI